MDQVATSKMIRDPLICGDNLVRKDDMGNPWMTYEEAPIDSKFNYRRLNGGRFQYEYKDKNGRVNTYITEPDTVYTYDRNFSTSGIPIALKGKTFSDFEVTLYSNMVMSQEAVRKAKGYVKNFKKLSEEGVGLFIYSKFEGSGKSFLASIVANKLMEEYGLSVKFVKAVNFFSEIKRSIGENKNDAYNKSNLLQGVLDSSVLIIDDIGAGSQSSYISDLVYEIISKRAEAQKVTIFTGKKAFAELPYDSSTLVQIQEKCIAIMLPSENVAKTIIKENHRRYEELLNE